ncbi:uncharacterized protein K489DRAFT_320692 [Dissoconium aciculare CBS 342.82]|uniref:N-acetyltransferase domain-containing protein n=1 Tax=Dissoconium aciculare CBS 342.82 TaxID=1314786 RepID=A0A6J3M3A4_9PEZI|nr:uncharacterized protein K489DRAFT_320692 [Dissoconium aciculare CBS 342.82]KAF1822475.1 hypothetical protein K489DRAFT_320692 [Dissoconium aciculare CBS 342.82]
MVNDFRGAHAALKEKHLGAKAHVYLHVLATRPGFQRRGVGALSMQWGAEKADALGLLSYVESSAQGVGLYARYGFVEVDVSPFDGRKWGHGDELRVVIMVRSPKGSSSS